MAEQDDADRRAEALVMGEKFIDAARHIDACRMETLIAEAIRAAVQSERERLQAPPGGCYGCGCPARWAERRIDAFCCTHYRPLKMTEGAGHG